MGRSLRAVGLAITLVSIVTFSTIGYTVFADVNTFVGSLHSGSGIALSGGIPNGSTTLMLNLTATVQNQGLYPLSITLSCSSSQQDGATCTTAQTTILPGQTDTLVFVMTVPNGIAYAQGLEPLHINGSATFALVPFASVTVSSDFGSFFRAGGS